MAESELEINEETHKEVEEWLKTVFGADRVPEYEVNETTVGILYQIMTDVKASDKDVEELIKNYELLAECYSSEAKKITEILVDVGLSLEDFSEDCQKIIKSLAFIACTLDLKEPTSTNFLLALNFFRRTKMDLAAEKRKQTQMHTKLDKKINAVSKTIEVLRRELKAAEESHNSQIADVTKKNSKLEFLKSKSVEYASTVKKLEEQLKNSGFDASISHTQLVKRSEELKKLEEELKSVSLKIDSYQVLPPNEALAKLKVEEARSELFQLEQELQRNIEAKTSEFL